MPEDKIKDIELYVKGLLMRLMNYENSTQEVREQVYDETMVLIKLYIQQEVDKYFKGSNPKEGE